MDPMTWHLGAVALVVTCGALVLRPSPPSGVVREASSRAAILPAVLASAVVLGLVAAQHQPLVIGWCAAGAVVLGGGLWQLRRARRSARARRGSDSVVAACEALVADLDAGLAPSAALVEAAQSCPALVPVADTAALGGDVVPAMDRASSTPGCADLRLVAAAWEVSRSAGVGLAFSLAQVAGMLRSRNRCRRVVTTELASARATARLMAGLPLLTWLLGAGTGAAPWQFLLGSGAGVACLVLGLALALAGVAWIDHLATRVERRL